MVQKLETLIGPMFSGKSDELIRRLSREQVAKNEIIVFKPKLDTRTTNSISSRRGQEVVNYLPAFPVENSTQLLEFFQEIYRQFKEFRPYAPIIVGIDEIQFFDDGIVEALYTITHEYNCKVIVSGLSRDFRDHPFGPMPQILAMSQEIATFAALCTFIVDEDTKTQCNQEATETYRSLYGEPCDYNDPVVKVGDKAEGYEARCLNHHFVKNHPKRQNKS